MKLGLLSFAVVYADNSLNSFLLKGALRSWELALARVYADHDSDASCDYTKLQTEDYIVSSTYYKCCFGDSRDSCGIPPIERSRLIVAAGADKITVFDDYVSSLLHWSHSIISAVPPCDAINVNDLTYKGISLSQRLVDQSTKGGKLVCLNMMMPNDLISNLVNMFVDNTDFYLVDSSEVPVDGAMMFASDGGTIVYEEPTVTPLSRKYIPNLRKVTPNELAAWISTSFRRVADDFRSFAKYFIECGGNEYASFENTDRLNIANQLVSIVTYGVDHEDGLVTSIKRVMEIALSGRGDSLSGNDFFKFYEIISHGRELFTRASKDMKCAASLHRRAIVKIEHSSNPVNHVDTTEYHEGAPGVSVYSASSPLSGLQQTYGKHYPTSSFGYWHDTNYDLSAAEEFEMTEADARGMLDPWWIGEPLTEVSHEEADHLAVAARPTSSYMGFPPRTEQRNPPQPEEPDYEQFKTAMTPAHIRTKTGTTSRAQEGPAITKLGTVSRVHFMTGPFLVELNLGSVRNLNANRIAVTEYAHTFEQAVAAHPYLSASFYTPFGRIFIQDGIINYTEPDLILERIAPADKEMFKSLLPAFAPAIITSRLEIVEPQNVGTVNLLDKQVSTAYESISRTARGNTDDERDTGLGSEPLPVIPISIFAESSDNGLGNEIAAPRLRGRPFKSLPYFQMHHSTAPAVAMNTEKPLEKISYEMDLVARDFDAHNLERFAKDSQEQRSTSSATPGDSESNAEHPLQPRTIVGVRRVDSTEPTIEKGFFWKLDKDTQVEELNKSYPDCNSHFMVSGRRIPIPCRRSNS